MDSTKIHLIHNTCRLKSRSFFLFKEHVVPKALSPADTFLALIKIIPNIGLIAIIFNQKHV